MVILNFVNNSKIRQYFKRCCLLLVYISFISVGAQNKDLYVAPNTIVSGLQNIYAVNNTSKKQISTKKNVKGIYVTPNTTVSGLQNIYVATNTITKQTPTTKSILFVGTNVPLVWILKKKT